ncbi:MAG TPA: PDDEXK nuclease domain-containing protein [Acetomicrobium sp.]|nr:PDDEXK nuclease domain-containing protein [Acetomicrobium sp.]
MKKVPTAQNYSTLVTDLASLIEQGRKAAVRYVNAALVATYWLMGRRIVEYEQKGKERAEYGEALLKKISADLTPRFGKGFTERNLGHMRQFYISYQKILNTPCAELEEKPQEKAHTVCAELAPISQTVSGISETLSRKFPLSWSHYRLLMRIEEPFKREFYEAECIRGNWSVRQLDRQIQSMLYERTALSKRKMAVIAKAHEKPITLKPEDEIKDPYILEFLGLKDEYSESQLEEALIRHLEHFLLELGIGFTFVARQKRITLEGSHYRLDLLLYHRILRCLVAIDLKIGEFSHADAGQMNLYVNYLKDKEKLSEENDPVGIILCTDKKNTVVEYALGGMSNKIFASKYRLQLPDPEVLKTEIEHEKQRLIEMNIVKEEKKSK